MPAAGFVCVHSAIGLGRLGNNLWDLVARAWERRLIPLATAF